jgi:hypothetical protein
LARNMPVIVAGIYCLVVFIPFLGPVLVETKPRGEAGLHPCGRAIARPAYAFSLHFFRRGFGVGRVSKVVVGSFVPCRMGYQV